MNCSRRTLSELACQSTIAFPLLIIAAFALYAQSFGHQWTYDDFPVLVNNPDIKSWAAFLENTYPGRPLREISYLIDHSLFGGEPAGYHFQNILWHGLNSSLIFLLAMRLQKSSFGAWAASLLFLVHPLQVEVVANISHRKDSLCLFFFLLAVICYCDFLKSRVKWRLVAVLACFVLSFAAKQTAVVLPVILACYEWSLVPRERRALLKYPPLFVGAIVAGAAIMVFRYVYFLKVNGHFEKMGSILKLRANWVEGNVWQDYYLTVLKSWAFMTEKVFVPTNLALEYTYPAPEHFFDIKVIGAIVGIIIVGVALFFSRRRYPAVFFALVWICVLWLPVSNVWPLTYFSADRYMYAPLVGFCILFSLTFEKIFKTASSGKIVVLLVVVGVLSCLTWQQNGVWKNSETLWKNALKVSPESTFTLNNLGFMALMSGDYSSARSLLERAQRNRFNPNPFDNLGWLDEKEGNIAAAISNYQNFIRLTKNSRMASQRERRVFLKEYLRKKYGIE